MRNEKGERIRYVERIERIERMQKLEFLPLKVTFLFLVFAKGSARVRSFLPYLPYFIISPNLLHGPCRASFGRPATNQNGWEFCSRIIPGKLCVIVIRLIAYKPTRRSNLRFDLL